MQSEYFRVVGVPPGSLAGDVQVPGAKNAALPALAAACLGREPTLLRRVPLGLNDVKVMIRVLRSAGATIEIVGDDAVQCSGPEWSGGTADANQVAALRHSLFLLGVSAYWGRSILLPGTGGCALGARKHDLHVASLAALGYDVADRQDGVEVAEGGSVPRAAEYDFHYPSFGATLNAVFAALAPRHGTSVLRNVAVNPEVRDVVALLRKMGGTVEYDGKTLVVRGAALRGGVEHDVMPDRIVAATLIAAVGCVGGEAVVRGIAADALETELAVWRQAGLSIGVSGLEMRVSKPWRMRAVDVRTSAYPGFHTDIQPLHAAMMCVAEGSCTITETILDGRFKYAEQLKHLGASVAVENGDFVCVNGAPGQVLRINGVRQLRPARLVATDIRGGAAAVLLALCAEGECSVENIYQIERGYAELPQLLAQLGAIVRREVNHEVRERA